MPSIKKRMAGFIRQLSVTGQVPNENGNETEQLPPKSPTTGCFIQRYLNGEVRRPQPAILYGKSGQELPVRRLASLDRRIYAAYTGPDGGLTSVNRNQKHVSSSEPDLMFIDGDDTPSTPNIHRRHPSNNKGKTFWDQQRRSWSWEGVTLFSHIYGTCFLPRRTRWGIDGRIITKCDNSRVRIRAMGKVFEIRDNNENVVDANSNTIVNNGAKEDVNNEELVNGHVDNIVNNGQQQCKNEVIQDPLEATANEEIAGVINWNRKHNNAYGAATTLYECHPITQQHAGNPIADSYAIVARSNNAILALADGVNWGEKASLAARCAVHGCVDYLNKALIQGGSIPRTTADIFVALLRSFHAAHRLILQEGGLLTTLTAAVIVPLLDAEAPFALCVCNVGDSLAYVYSQRHGVREATQGSHDIHSMRDMRDALGALGPVDGQNPELSNLTCSLTLLETGDVVFLTSDGVSDNFDPVVGKFAIPKKPETPGDLGTGNNNSNKPSTPRGLPRAQSMADESMRPETYLPVVEAFQRHELTLLRMEDLLYSGVSGQEQPARTADRLCEQMVEFATRLTAAKRRLLEDPELYMAPSHQQELSRSEQRARRRRVCEKLSLVPGKLDHASVVAYVVGIHREMDTLPEEEEEVKAGPSCGEEIEQTVLPFLESVV